MIRGYGSFPASYAVTQFFKFRLSVGVYPPSPSMVLEMEKLNIRFGIRQYGHRESRRCGGLSEINVGERQKLELTWTRAQEVAE